MSDFDPAAFLAKKAPVDFDPEAFLGRMSPMESVGNAAVHGATAGFDQNINGAVQALIDKGMGDTRSFGDLYRYNRDAITRTNDKALRDNPKAYIGTSLLAAAPLALVTGGAGEGATVASVAKAGGLMGALNALGNSRADLTTGEGANYLQAAKDVSGYQGAKNAIQDFGEGRPIRSALDILGAGALGGALTSGTAGTATKLLPMALRGARTGLEDLAVWAGRKALLPGAAKSLSNELPLEAAPVLEAIRSHGILPGSTVEGNARRLNALTSQVGDVHGANISNLESLGVQGGNSREVANELQALGREAELNNMDPRVARAYFTAADRVLEKSQLAEDAGVATTARLGLRQEENLKRSAQDAADFGRIEDTPVNIANKRISGVLRQDVERATQRAAENAGPSSEIAELASGFVPTKQRLGNLIDARDAARYGAAKASHRSLVSMPELMALGGGAATGHGIAGALFSTGLHLIGPRGPSTAAFASYYGSRAANSLARMATNNQAKTALLLNALSGSSQRADEGVMEDPERQALLDALLGASPPASP
jgi:hypothetical protein